jgi:hypothetical protein
MPKQCKQERKIDGRTALTKRRRALIAAYEAQIGSALFPATRKDVRQLRFSMSLYPATISDAQGCRIESAFIILALPAQGNAEL